MRLQQAFFFEPVQQSVGKRLADEVDELASVDGVVGMFPCVVELQSMLVEPHDEPDLPSRGIALSRLGWSQVRVADEDDRPEAPAFLFVVPGIVVSVLSPVPKIVALLLHGSDGIAEGIEEPAVGKRMLLILDVPPSVRENAFERKHGMVSDHEGTSLQRRKVVEVAVFL